MMVDGITHKVLKKFKESLVVTKSELIQLVKNDIKNPEDPRNVIDAVTKMFVQKGWIIPLYASRSTFAITQKGIKA